MKTLMRTGIYDERFVLNMDETGFSLEEVNTKTICFDDEEEFQVETTIVGQKDKTKNKMLKHPTVRSCRKDKEYYGSTLW